MAEALILRMLDGTDTALRLPRILVDVFADDAPSILRGLRLAAYWTLRAVHSAR
ncbi:hypothetical protein ACGFYP_34215 [Streptomyces sp. NPDC048370]|uniref:hypothetical protein n=1 Tax=Streptomyces sp. NPDC048370 TaxID=3365540 RepID=UPI00371D9501